MVKGRENWPKFKKSDDETLIKMKKCGSNMLEIWNGNLTSNEDIWRVEAPSAFMHGNGRSLGKLAAYMANGGTFEGKCLLNEDFLKVESPSAFTMSNGRSLGKLAAYMANGGTLNGNCMFNEEGWNKFHGEKTRGPFFGPCAEDIDFS